MLEEMSDFFERRIDVYDEHMLTCIEGAKEFYPYTAGRLPNKKTAVYSIWVAARVWNWKHTFR